MQDWDDVTSFHGVGAFTSDRRAPWHELGAMIASKKMRAMIACAMTRQNAVCGAAQQPLIEATVRDTLPNVAARHLECIRQFTGSSSHDGMRRGRCTGRAVTASSVAGTCL